MANTDRLLPSFGLPMLTVFQPVVSMAASRWPCQKHQRHIRQIEPLSHAIGCTLLKRELDITVSGLFTPGQPATHGFLASKVPVGCLLPGEEETHAAQPAQGEDRPLARAGRLKREADPI